VGWVVLSMEEIDNFNFLIVREHDTYELCGQVGRDLQRVLRASIQISTATVKRKPQIGKPADGDSPEGHFVLENRIAGRSFLWYLPAL
jgi:hypothetical protein